MSGSGEIFRSRLAFRPFVLAVGGVALLLIAFVVQAHVSYIREREFGRRNWRAELRLDFSGPEAQQTNFLPIVKLPRPDVLPARRCIFRNSGFTGGRRADKIRVFGPPM
jgi:hypothetical protein